MSHNDIIKMINSTDEKIAKVITLNERQTSKILGVSPSTLAKWRHDGIGPAFIKNSPEGSKGRVLYSKFEIANWITNSSIKTM